MTFSRAKKPCTRQASQTPNLRPVVGCLERCTFWDCGFGLVIWSGGLDWVQAVSGGTVAIHNRKAETSVSQYAIEEKKP